MSLPLEALVQSGDLARYDWYRGMSGDDLLYLVLPSGRELHIAASILTGSRDSADLEGHDARSHVPTGEDVTRVTLVCPMCGYQARRDLSNEVACRGTHETSSEPGLCPHGHGLLKRKDGVQQERWALWPSRVTKYREAR